MTKTARMEPGVKLRDADKMALIPVKVLPTEPDEMLRKPSWLKIKLPKYTDGNYATTLWTSKGEPTDKLTDETIFERIPKGCNIRMLFQVQKIWFSGKTKCGCIINAIQMKVYKPKNNTNKCLMENDSD